MSGHANLVGKLQVNNPCPPHRKYWKAYMRSIFPFWRIVPSRDSPGARSKEFDFARHTELGIIMSRFASIFTAAIIFLCSSGWCNLADGWKTADEEVDLNGDASPQLERSARRHPAVFVRENLHDALYSAPDISKRGTSFLEGRTLDGPALLASWLGIRQLTCDDSNYFICASAFSPPKTLIAQLKFYR
jgi:hypothetical protein